MDSLQNGRNRRVISNVKSGKRVGARRAQLVEAAMKLFARKGFHTTTVREIGRAAGLTQGTIYNYVRSKEDILYLVCDTVLTQYQDAVVRAVHTTGGKKARIEAAVRALIDGVPENEEELLLIFQESHALNRKSIHAILSRMEAFNSIVGRAMQLDSGVVALPSGNQCLAINIVTFLPTIIALRRWALRGKVSRRDLVEGLVEFTLRGLGLVKHLKQKIAF
jgi:AcrR family transcriptional regulator